MSAQICLETNSLRGLWPYAGEQSYTKLACQAVAYLPYKVASSRRPCSQQPPRQPSTTHRQFLNQAHHLFITACPDLQFRGPLWTASDHINDSGKASRRSSQNQLYSRLSQALLHVTFPIVTDICLLFGMRFVRASRTCIVNTHPSLIAWFQWVVCMLTVRLDGNNKVVREEGRFWILTLIFFRYLSHTV